MPTLRALAALFTFWLFLVGCSSEGGGPSSSSATASPPSTAAPAASAPSASVATTASATPAPSASAAETQPTDRPPPFLWEVTKGGKKSWLFGTMHLGTDAEKELHPVVFERLSAARIVVFEANVFDMDPFAAAKLAMLPPGESVKNKIKPESWKALVDRVGSILMPESTLERFKPWFLVTLVLQDMLPKTEPMDATLYNRAKSAQKELVFLETVEEQVTLVDKSMDIKLLDDTLSDLPLAERMLLGLADAYRKGDLDKLNALTFDPVEMKKHPAMFDTLLFERNRRWIPKLVPLLEKGDVFVAVGAAHLLGDKSVTELLVQKGYAAKRDATAVNRK